MKRVIAFCEGPSEETFLNKLLAPALVPYNVYLFASSCGGVSKYSIIKKNLTVLCKSDPTAIITTMLDYYALPSDTPGMALNSGEDIYRKVAKIEHNIYEDIGTDNLIPNLTLHEFEALLFSKPECFSYCVSSPSQLRQLCQIRERAESPEHINNGPDTAPSKRILRIYPEYSKIVDGYNIARDIGIDVMRRECHHFDEWVQKLIRLGD